MKKLLAFVLLIATLVLMVYAMPVARISLNQKEYKFPSLDINALFGNQSDVGNLRRSSGIFESNVYEVTLQESVDKQTFDEIFNILNSRLEIASLSDIELKAYYNSNSSFFEFKVPSYYHDQENMIFWLTKSGEISFTAVDQEGKTTQANLTSSSLLNSKVAYNATYKDHLKLNLTEVGKTNYYSILLAQNSVIMNIDGREEFILIPQVDSQSTQDITSEVLLVLNEEFSTLKQKQMTLNLANSIINTKPLNLSIKLTNTRIDAPEYSMQGASIYVYSLILLLLTALSFAYQKLSRSQFAKYIWSVGLSLSLMIVLLKFVSATVSVGTVFASFIFITLILILLFELIKEENFITYKNNLVKIFVYIVVLNLLLLFANVQIKYLYDMLGIFVSGSLSLIIVLSYPITIINNISND